MVTTVTIMTNVRKPGSRCVSLKFPDAGTSTLASAGFPVERRKRLAAAGWQIKGAPQQSRGSRNSHGGAATDTGRQGYGVTWVCGLRAAGKR